MFPQLLDQESTCRYRADHAERALAVVFHERLRIDTFGDKNLLYKREMQYIIVMQDIYCIISKAVFLLENGKNERVKQARIETGLSQQQLADAVGATRQTIGLIEAGRYNPSLKLCTAICKTLGKTLDDLFWE